MKKIILIMAILAISLVPNVQANWYCDGWYNDCGSTYPKECCVVGGSGDVFPMCIKDNYDCSERCCTGGGCDSYDDYRVCPVGDIAICNIDNPPYNMACCDPGEKWFAPQRECVPESWDCIYDEECPSNQECDNHQCITPTCPAEFWDCQNAYTKQFHSYAVLNHKCQLFDAPPIECGITELCESGKLCGYNMS